MSDKTRWEVMAPNAIPFTMGQVLRHLEALASDGSVTSIRVKATFEGDDALAEQMLGSEIVVEIHSGKVTETGVQALRSIIDEVYHIAQGGGGMVIHTASYTDSGMVSPHSRDFRIPATGREFMALQIDAPLWGETLSGDGITVFGGGIVFETPEPLIDMILGERGGAGGDNVTVITLDGEGVEGDVVFNLVDFGDEEEDETMSATAVRILEILTDSANPDSILTEVMAAWAELSEDVDDGGMDMVRALDGLFPFGASGSAGGFTSIPFDEGFVDNFLALARGGAHEALPTFFGPDSVEKAAVTAGGLFHRSVHPADRERFIALARGQDPVQQQLAPAIRRLEGILAKLEERA